MADGHILVVEDDIELAELLAETLRREGYRVTLHHRGDSAVATVQRERPDLVVLDVMLPGADGFDVLRQLRPAYTGAVLMLTARADAFDQVSGLELGADDYVAKPVLPRVLVARVRALLRRARPAAAPVEDGRAPIVVVRLRSEACPTAGLPLMTPAQPSFSLMSFLQLSDFKWCQGFLNSGSTRPPTSVGANSSASPIFTSLFSARIWLSMVEPSSSSTRPTI